MKEGQKKIENNIAFSLAETHYDIDTVADLARLLHNSLLPSSLLPPAYPPTPPPPLLPSNIFATKS